MVASQISCFWVRKCVNHKIYLFYFSVNFPGTFDYSPEGLKNNRKLNVSNVCWRVHVSLNSYVQLFVDSCYACISIVTGACCI